MQVVLLGSGNVATILGRLIKDSPHTVTQVYGRNSYSIMELANELNAEYTGDANNINKNADIYIIAVTDNAIPLVAAKLSLNNHLVVHTAGSVSKNVLHGVSKNYGVLYPLQSLLKATTRVPEIPLLVDGNTGDSLTLIQDFAAGLSNQIKIANDENRMHYHLAAVFANNFTNHLLVLAEEYCKKTNADFGLLLPLIKQTAERLEYSSPSQLQTGPASRGDDVTIKKHIDMLKGMSDMQGIYKMLTESIKNK